MDLIPFILPVGVLFVLVAVQRQRARSWGTTADTQPSDDSIQRRPNRFSKVWLQTTAPRAAMRAYRDRQTGDLLIDPTQQAAEFRSKSGPVLDITNVSVVHTGGRGTDFVNTWIELHAYVDSKPTTLYLMDGGWFGWRPLLTGSNLRIVKSLARLTPAQPG